jgi:hypothetical protein
MKLPRWLVVCMLSVSGLSVLVAPGWWWVTWPEWTASEFVEMIREHELSEARRFSIGGTFDPFMAYLEDNSTSETALKALQVEVDGPQSLQDLFLGRQKLRLSFTTTEVSSETTISGEMSLVAQRGRVIFNQISD